MVRLLYSSSLRNISFIYALVHIGIPKPPLESYKYSGDIPGASLYIASH